MQGVAHGSHPGLQALGVPDLFSKDEEEFIMGVESAWACLDDKVDPDSALVMMWTLGPKKECCF